MRSLAFHEVGICDCRLLRLSNIFLGFSLFYTYPISTFTFVKQPLIQFLPVYLDLLRFHCTRKPILIFSSSFPFFYLYEIRLGTGAFRHFCIQGSLFPCIVWPLIRVLHNIWARIHRPRISVNRSPSKAPPRPLLNSKNLSILKISVQPACLNQIGPSAITSDRFVTRRALCNANY